MKLVVKYFASIREEVGIGQEMIDINVSAITLDTLRETLATQDSRKAEALRRERPVRLAVNHEMVSGTYTIREDSEVAFFPPVTGG